MGLVIKSFVCREFKVCPRTDGKPWEDFKQDGDIISLMSYI